VKLAAIITPVATVRNDENSRVMKHLWCNVLTLWKTSVCHRGRSRTTVAPAMEPQNIAARDHASAVSNEQDAHVAPTARTCEIGKILNISKPLCEPRGAWGQFAASPTKIRDTSSRSETLTEAIQLEQGGEGVSRWSLLSAFAEMI
jgi:hypothetical protein